MNPEQPMIFRDMHAMPPATTWVAILRRRQRPVSGTGNGALVIAPVIKQVKTYAA
jgi:hypothetical protein